MTDEPDVFTEYPQVLADLHASLTDRFGALTAARRKLDAPVFALEHDLGDGELSRLSAAVQACVSAGQHAAISRRS